MSDELFTATIPDRPRFDPPPWRPESILYPAAFGGPLAAATLGVLNGRRLGLPAAPLLAIAGVGAAGIAIRIAVTAALDTASAARLLGAIAGALVWLVVLVIQRRPFRAFTYGDGKPASLIGPGLAAAFGCGLLEAILVYVVTQ